jgi:hypothetical protein
LLPSAHDSWNDGALARSLKNVHSGDSFDDRQTVCSWWIPKKDSEAADERIRTELNCNRCATCVAADAEMQSNLCGETEGAAF